MAISFVGAGTSSTANNAAVTPVAHASTTAGDIVIVHTTVRNVAAATATPVGWTRVAGQANQRVYARVWEAGDVIPSFTPVGGSAGDDVIGQAVTFRGAERNASSVVGGTDAGPLVQANGAATTIAYPAYGMPADRHTAVLFLWKQGAATAHAGISGMSQAVFDQATAGNDASASIKYQLQTAEVDYSSGNLSVTGGGSSVSSATWIYLRPAAQIAVAEHGTWPVRTLISVTGLTLGDSIDLYRDIAGSRTLVRAGSSDAVTDQAFVKIDAELPFGVALSYVAIVNDGIVYQSAVATYTLVGGKVAITDAISGLAAEVVIQEWPSRRRERRSTTFIVNAKNVVVSGGLGQFAGQVVLFTETFSSAGNLETVLEGATGGVVQIRQPGPYERVDSYVCVISVEETRYDEGDGLDERRLWVLDAVETDPWAPELPAAGYSYEDLYDAYTGLTYQDLANDFSGRTYLDLAQESF